ncbi:RNA exonuclease 5 [Gastrophryne carolinensis]
MSEENAKRKDKRPHCDEGNDTDIKKSKTGHKTCKINGITLHKIKKAPRLSSALFNDNCEIQLGSLHQLIKYAVLGKKHGTTQAKWCSIHHQKRLCGVVVVMLEDLSQHHFYEFYTHFQNLRRLFHHRFSLPPPPHDYLASLIGLKPSDTLTETDKQINSDPSSLRDPSNQLKCSAAARFSPLHDPILQKYGKEKHGLTRYLLSEEEMIKNEYPCIDSLNRVGFVHSNCTEAPTDSSPLFGLDCEMCLTSKGSELTRVSLVDADGNCIMDELVKPDNPIQNYMTRFSGITSKMLLHVKTKLKDVQEKLKQLLPPDAVLVGHSLNNDLQALQMIHPNVIDTSLLFVRDFNKRFKLKFLAQAVLKKVIQCDDVVGHNPSEDAAAALKLAQYFIAHGPEKVAHLNLEHILSEPDSSDINHTTKNKQNGLTLTQASEHPDDQISLVESLQKNVQKIIYVGRAHAEINSSYSGQVENISCASNDEVLERACKVAPLSPLTLVNYQRGSIFSRHSKSTNEKVKCKFVEMRTVFAGPFKGNVCLKSVKLHFQICGPISSINLISDTSQPYVCIIYSVLEAAQLAVEHLNGTHIDGCHVKVQRLVTKMTLDYDDILKDMEEDPENRDTIYVSGFIKPLTHEALEEHFSHLKEIKAIYVPRNHCSLQYAKYCYIKFQSLASASVAAGRIKTHGAFMCRRAVTSSHLNGWLQQTVVCAPSSTVETTPKADLLEMIKNTDEKMMRFYEKLAVNTLCVILFPGNNSDSGVLPGFGLMGIKTD